MLVLAYSSIAQSTDSIYHQLHEVEIHPFSQEAQLRLLSSESMIGRQDLEKQASYSLLPALNTVPGVRMEERSPGSYRLSIRGSLLRSPYGVRNVKIYLGDFPFTDAGGNAYLNSLDAGNLNSLRILRGPEASIFGANTGGVLLVDPAYKSNDSLKIIAGLSGGSYGLLHQNLLVQQRSKSSLFTVANGYQRADGYRQNSAMQRHCLQLTEAWSYRPGAQLRALALFSDLFYQTPGGLTLQQFENDPRQARPATLTLPGASAQKAAVYNKLFFGGIAHDWQLTKGLRHVITLSGAYSHFENPFITNYEQRIERTFGARTYLDGTLGTPETLSAKWNVGGECQQTNSGIANFGNKAGVKDTVQTSDDLQAIQAFAFARFLVDLRQRVLLEASLSYNFYTYYYKNNFPYRESSFHHKAFDPQLMPRLALSYKITEHLSWRASAGRGYSAPTLAEIRSSNNIVNTALQAETGWNYETGFRMRDRKEYLWVEATAFYYRLEQAIVRRVNDDGTDYFINAGGTEQPGLELQVSAWLLKLRETGFFRAIQMKGNVTRNWFTFRNYSVAGSDYSGHSLTGVADYTSAESLYLQFPLGISLFTQYYYTAAIPLNDAGTAKARPYHLVQAKAEWKTKIKTAVMSLSAGIDNLLNETYSLGNDLNAAAGRYYNAAAPRNYYGGIKVEF